ncbi:tetratricopeptide repeat protein [Viscerimonas tarda]
MTKKYLLGALFGFLISSLTYAQNVGIDYFSTDELEIAKDIFEKQLNVNAPEANYYLGEIAYAKGESDKAKSYYQQGLAASPAYVLNNVGLGKLLLKTDAKAAENEFSTALKKDKKNVEVIVAIARAYYQNGLKDKLASRLEDARKANKKSPLIYVFEGDMLKDAEKLGDAAGWYAQAINFAPDYTIAYIKTAQVYERINPATAIDALKKVLEINPDYKLAYKYQGNIYYTGGQYAKAIDAYKTFFADKTYSAEDLTHYAASLFFSKNYDEAKALISEGIKKDANNFVLNRLLTYSAVELEDYANGLIVADKFFSLDKGTSEYIARDYITYGKILIENGQIDKALEQYDLAIKLDPTQFDLYKEIAGTLADAGRTIDAANYFRKYIDLAGEKAEALDYYNMGRYYYMAAGSGVNSEEAEVLAKIKEHLLAADTAFATVATRVSDSHLGSFWRARANSLLDVIAGKETKARPQLAKPYYEAAIDIILAKEEAEKSNAKELIEAYRYLNSYYYLLYDETKSPEAKANTILYGEKLLSLDPENAQAKQIVEALK